MPAFFGLFCGLIEGGMTHGQSLAPIVWHKPIESIGAGIARQRGAVLGLKGDQYELALAR